MVALRPACRSPGAWPDACGCEEEDTYEARGEEGRGGREKWEGGKHRPRCTWQHGSGFWKIRHTPTRCAFYACHLQLSLPSHHDRQRPRSTILCIHMHVSAHRRLQGCGIGHQLGHQLSHIRIYAAGRTTASGSCRWHVSGLAAPGGLQMVCKYYVLRAELNIARTETQTRTRVLQQNRHPLPPAGTPAVRRALLFVGDTHAREGTHDPRSRILSASPLLPSSRPPLPDDPRVSLFRFDTTDRRSSPAGVLTVAWSMALSSPLLRHSASPTNLPGLIDQAFLALSSLPSRQPACRPPALALTVRFRDRDGHPALADSWPKLVLCHATAAVTT